MNQINLEPAYLRYIYDGLLKGSIHPENAAELPDGLIGLYEEAFDEKHPVQHRQHLLERFAIWGLLKKEVSAQFVAEVLNQPMVEIQEFIATYSAWFNSPESGKYQLYHERLKVYLLQKLSEHELDLIHTRLIEKLELSIDGSTEEFEVYALAFLAQHYCIDALKDGNGEKLISFCYDQSIWKRQIEKSKSYLWTRSALLSLMTWASKYSDEEVVECSLHFIDLYHQEQNDFQSVILLVKNQEFNQVKERLKSLGNQNSVIDSKRNCLLLLYLLKVVVDQQDSDRKVHLDWILSMLLEQFEKLNNQAFQGKFIQDLAFHLRGLDYDTKSILSSDLTNEYTLSHNHQLIEPLQELKSLCDELSGQELDVQILHSLIDREKHNSNVIGELVVFLKVLRKHEVLRLNKYNALVSWICEILLSRGITEIERLVQCFRVGLTTKSINYNSFMMNWLNNCILNEDQTRCEYIIDHIFDLNTRTKALFLFAASMNETEQFIFLTANLEDISVNEENIDVIIDYCFNNEFNSEIFELLFQKAMKRKLALDGQQLFEANYELIELLHQKMDYESQLSLFRATLLKIKQFSHNLSIREHVIVKMAVRLFSLMSGTKLQSEVIDDLKQLYNEIEDFEDWLQIITEITNHIHSDDSLHESFLKSISAYVQQLFIEHLTLPERQLKRLIQENFILLKSVFVTQQNNSVFEDLCMKLGLQIAAQSSMESREIQFTLDSYIQQICKELPLLKLQEVQLYARVLRMSKLYSFGLYKHKSNSIISSFG